MTRCLSWSLQCSLQASLSFHPSPAAREVWRPCFWFRTCRFQSVTSMPVCRSKFRPGNVKDETGFLTSPLESFLSPNGSGDLGPLRGRGGLWTLYVSVQLASHGRGLGVPRGSLFKWSVFLPLQGLCSGEEESGHGPWGG